MGTIELGGGAGTPPVGSSPSIVLPTQTPADGELIKVDNVPGSNDPIPLPDQVPVDGVVQLDGIQYPGYGVDRLINLLDVRKTRVDRDILYFDAATGFYTHAQPETFIDFPVDSVFGRTGDVVAVYGDYSAAIVTYVPTSPMSATDVQGAIDELTTLYAKNFLELDDTPSSYIGQAGKFATVNALEDGLFFTTVATINYDPVTDTYYLPPTVDGQVQNLGQEVFINCVDETLSGETASDPKVFMVVGTNSIFSNFLNVSKPIASSIPKGVPFGLNTTDVDPVTGKFKLITYGYVNGVDTSAWTLGDLLWVDPTTPGEMTNVEPTENPYAVGIVAIEDNTNGSIFVSTIYPIGTTGQNIAGIVHQELWFTADVASGAPTFYAVKLEDQGVTASLQLSVIVDDNQTLPLPSDFLSDIYPVPQRFFKGTYNGRIEAEVDDSGANEIFTIEIYLADSAGAVVDSGITEEPIGDLGVRPLATLDSGIRNMSAAQLYEIDVSGILRKEIILPANHRFRGHILCTKLGTEGAAKTFNIYSGNTRNTFIRVPPFRQLNDLGDVNITTPLLNQFLVYDGTHWVNDTFTATLVAYDNSTSGLAATNVQDAIDELDGLIDAITGDYVDLTSNQTVAGEKTWSDLAVFNDIVTFTGTTAAIFENAASTTTTIVLDSSSAPDTRTLIQQTSSRFAFTPDSGVDQFVINEAGRDVDIRFESDTDPNAFYLQGSDGFLGLGNATPLYKLDVLGTIRANSTTTAIIKINSDAAVGVARSFIQMTRGLSPTEYGWDFSSNLSQANDELTFRSIVNSVATSRVTVLSDGKFGIGTTSPDSILHINGGVGLIDTGLTFGDGDTGIFESADDTLRMQLSTSFYWVFDKTVLYGNAAGGGRVYNQTASATTPGLGFTGDSDTGIGQAGLNQLSLIAGGVESARFEATQITFPILPSDDTEDHVVAIDDVTGILTKRAVSTIFNNLTGQVTSVGAVTTMSTTAITDWTTPASFVGGENFLVEFSGTLYEMPWALMETYLDAVYAPISVVGDYVDLTTNQTVAGQKTFTDNMSVGGVTGGTKPLEIRNAANSHLRLSQDASNYVDLHSTNIGHLYIAPKGGRTYYVGPGVNNQFFAYDYTQADTYISFDANFIALRVTGTNRIRFNATTSSWITNNLGIGLDTGISAKLHVVGTAIIDGLASDDTEDHFVGIDDSTGLLTKRSVASLNSGFVDLTTNQSIGGIKTFTSSSVMTILTLDQISIEDGATTILKDPSNNLEFTDAITGSKTLAELAAGPLSLGTVGQVPYMNAGGTDFDYSASLHYTTGVFNAPNINVAAIAASSTPQLVTTAVATGALGTDTDLTWDGSILTVIGGALASDTLDLKNTGVAPVGIKEGRIWWNEQEYTLNIDSGLGPVLQAGQEMYLLIYNDTVSTITNFTALRPLAATVVGGLVIPTVQKTTASTWEGVEGTMMVATMDIPPSSVGLATRFGRARGGDASGTPYGEVWSPGDQIFISETPGELTIVRPEFPSYNISMGGVIDNSASPDGEIFVSFTRNFNNTFDNFWNGTIRESFSFTVTEAGGVVTGTLDTQETGNDYLTYIFEDGLYLQDVSTPPTITLTPGTDTAPATNYVYILESTKALTVSTSDWPSVEHIKIATIVLQSATTTGTNGALRNQNWNDHIQGTDGQGHLSHIGHKLRKFEAQWNSGTQGTSTVDAVPTPDDVWVQVTSGSTFQMHEQTFPAFDTETGDVVFVPNHFTTPYLSTSNLNVLLTDASGNSLNNTSFSFVLWGVQNSGSEPCQLMINLPTDSYAFASPDSAVNDALNYAVYTIPTEFQGVGFLIARFIYTYKNDVWVLYDTEDLRGRIPNLTAGGGGGGAGVTEFTALNDTPGSYVGQALSLLQVNAGETALEFTTGPTATTYYLNDTNTYIDESASEMRFTDAVSGSVLLSALISSLTVGTDGQIPYVNPAGNDFLYTSSLKYSLGVFYADGGITVASLAAGSTNQVLLTTVATGAFATSGNLTFDGSTLGVTGALTASGLATLGSLKFAGATTVDTIETTLTNDDTHLPTSGAVFDALAALPPGVSFGAAQYYIPYTNAGLDDFDYTSGFRYEMGVLYASNITIPAMAAASTPEVVLAAVATGALSSTSGLTYSGSVFTVNGGVVADALTLILQVDTIETTVTNDDSHLPTSGAVVDYVVANAYTHPNHTGQVTSVGDGAQTLSIAAITDWTSLTFASALMSPGDEVLITNSGLLKRLNLSNLNDYLETTLAFNDYTHPNHSGQVTSVGDGAQTLHVSAITDQTPAGALSGTDTWLRQSSGILTEATVTQIQTFMQNNLSFSNLSLGTSGQIPYMNGTNDDFSYNSGLVFSTGVLDVSGGFKSASLSVTTAPEYGVLLSAPDGDGTFSADANLAWDATSESLRVGGGTTSGTVYYDWSGATHAYYIRGNATSFHFGYYSTDIMTLTTSGLALATGARVNTIETTLTDDDTHIPTSGAVVDYVATLSSPWTTDAEGINYSGNHIGVGVDSNATVGVYIKGDSGVTQGLNYSNLQAAAAWSDYPAALPGHNRIFVHNNDATIGISNHYSCLLMGARGNTSGAANAWGVIALQSLSTTNHSGSWNFFLRGPGVSDYATIAKFQTGSKYYWQVESSSGDVTHVLRQATTDMYVFGYEDTLDRFVLNSGGSFSSGSGQSISGSRISMTNTGKLFIELDEDNTYSPTAANAASLYIYNTCTSNLTTNSTSLQMRVYNPAAVWLPIVQLSVRPLLTTTHDTVFGISLRANSTGTYYEAFTAQSDGIFYLRSEGTSEDIRVRYAQQAGGIVCTTGWDDGTAAYEIQIGSGGNFGTAPYYSFDTNVFSMFGTTSATITVDAATSTALLYLQAATNQDSRIHFRYNASTNAVCGWDAGLSIFQIHTGTAFTTLASGDFSISTSGYIYMGNLRSVSNTNYLRHNLSTGEVTYYSSDARLKKNIRDFEPDALAVLSEFKPRTFEWIAEDDDKTSHGWIAQEGVDHILNMFPIAPKTGLYAMAEGEILPYYHKAILQLKAEIEELKAQLK